MSAESGPVRAWPRRKRVAGFARGSASGGAVPIAIGNGRRSSLCRDILTQARAAGLHVLQEDGNATARITLAGGETIARVTRDSDLLVRLTPTQLEVLRERGWIAEEAAGLARVHGPRNATERDVAWRVLLGAREAAEEAHSAGAAAAPERPGLPLLLPDNVIATAPAA